MPETEDVCTIFVHSWVRFNKNRTGREGPRDLDTVSKWRRFYRRRKSLEKAFVAAVCFCAFVEDKVEGEPREEDST